MERKLKLFLSLMLLAAAVLFNACSSNGNEKNPKYADEVNGMDLPDDMKAFYEKSAELMDDIALLLKDFNLTRSEKAFLELSDLYGDLGELRELYDDLGNAYDKEGWSSDAKRFCKEHAFRVDSMRFVVKNILVENLPNIRQTIVNENDKLIEKEANYPFYLPKGTTLYIDGECSEITTLKLYNADSEHLIRSWNGKKAFHDSLLVNNGAVYVLNLTTKGSQYITLSIKKNLQSVEEIGKKYEITTTEVECKAGEARSRKIEAITINSIFEEPHKVTLRSQGKAFFSGGSRSIVAMQVPANCTDLLYNLRISTSQSDISSDGQFCNNVNEKYKEIKFLGLPLYESHGTSSNIFRELLNSSEPYREEEAYCNLYVFNNAEQAKKFMDDRAVSELKYNVDLSKQGTQSCNDRIPVKGMKTIYFGFENTRVRYSVYLWLESLATVKKTEYVKEKYVVE